MEYCAVLRFGNQTALTSSAQPMPAIETGSLLPSFSAELSLWDGLFGAGGATSDSFGLESGQQFATLFAAAVDQSSAGGAALETSPDSGFSLNAFPDSGQFSGRLPVDEASAEGVEVAPAGPEPLLLAWLSWGPAPVPIPTASVSTASVSAAELPVIGSNVAQANDLPVSPEQAWKAKWSSSTRPNRRGWAISFHEEHSASR